jgi:predicted DNA-binding transcriptional regulator AlpA
MEKIIALLERKPEKIPAPQTAQPAIDKDRYCNEKEAAHLTGLSKSWFQRKRWEGGGPPYSKIGNSVRYKLGDLIAWLELNRVRHTAEYYDRKQNLTGRQV